MLKKILLFLLVVLIAMQFFRPAKNTSNTGSPHSIATVYAIPENVNTILKTACNDCHSNNTYYPWYAEIQPIAWWLSDHVKEGKEKLNFDEFTTYRLRKQYHKLEETEEMVKEVEMPLNSYTWVHKDAKLSQQQQQQLISWAEGIRAQMREKYPIDSLVRKK